MQLVIAAITTEPWSSEQRSPLAVTSTAVDVCCSTPTAVWPPSPVKPRDVAVRRRRGGAGVDRLLQLLEEGRLGVA